MGGPVRFIGVCVAHTNPALDFFLDGLTGLCSALREGVSSCQLSERDSLPVTRQRLDKRPWRSPPVCHAESAGPSASFRSSPCGTRCGSYPGRTLTGRRPHASSLIVAFVRTTVASVPSRLVRRVLCGDYIDMAELSEEHLELELRRSLEGEESKPTSSHKLHPVPDLLTWVRSFCHFAGIVAKAHPDEAVDLWACLAIMLSGKDHGDWWRTYDSRFRQQCPSLEKAEFGRMDQALYTKAILSAGCLKSTQPPPSEGTSLPKGKKRKLMVCLLGMMGGCVLPRHAATNTCALVAEEIIGSQHVLQLVRGSRHRELVSDFHC